MTSDAAGARLSKIDDPTQQLNGSFSLKHYTPNQFKSIGYGRHDANPSALKNLQILKGQSN